MGIACEAGSLSSGASDAGVHSHSDDSRDGHDRDYHGGLGEWWWSLSWWRLR